MNSLIFLGRINFTSNDGSQSKFVYQTTLDTLKLNKDKDIDYVLSLKSKEAFNSKLKPLYTAFLRIISLSECRIVIKFINDTLALKQNNYFSKVVTFYFVYDLDVWPRNSTSNFKFTNCLFRATNIVKTSDKEKYLYRGYGITFGSAGSWSFEE